MLGEVGVEEVVPVVMELDREYRQEAVGTLKAEGEELLRQGSSVGGGSSPRLATPPRPLGEVVEMFWAEGGSRFFLWEGEARGAEEGTPSVELWEMGVGLASSGGRGVLLVGPKPGITRGEVEFLRGAGFVPVSLGPRLYTAPTALALALGVVVAAHRQRRDG